MSTAVKRACDACHRRKVKCDGINPCRNCSSSQLACTYNAIPQKKGPKGSRAKVISELRETQRQTSLSVKVQNRMNGIASPPSTPAQVATPGLLASDVVRECVEFFFANMYPTMPILHRPRLEQQILYMDQSLDAYCLLTSLCAFMMLQPGMTVPSSDPYGLDSMPGANIISATLLVEETLRARKGYDYQDSPTLNTLCTSYFLFGYYYGLDMHDKAWFHLREATTLLHMTGMNQEDTYRQYDAIEASRRRRLYWLFFVTERAYALQRRRPLTLQATISLPTAADDPTDPLMNQLTGFILLVNMFRPFDDAFVALWNRVRGDCSPSHVSAMQKQLQEVLPSYLTAPESQLAELQMNQQWLKNVQWQLGLANGNAAELYSIDIGRDLLPMVSHFPGSLGLIGLGLIEKLCEVSYFMTEYLSTKPASRDPFSIGPREHLHQILNVLSVLRNGDQRFLLLLLSRVHDVIPRLVNPMLQDAPDNACSIDIFDGFGNAGMAQPPHMFQTEEYDTKFAIARIDELSNDSGSSAGGAPPKNDLNSPFVSSPAIMSPGMEIGHGLSNDFQHPHQHEHQPRPQHQHQHQLHQHHQQQQHLQEHLQHQHQQHLQEHLQHQHLPHQHQHQQPQRHSITAFQNVNAQMNINQPSSMAIDTQSLNQSLGLGQGVSPAGNPMGNRLSNGISPGMGGGNVMGRQQPQRANSFAIPPSQIRTVEDFHALQRANASDLSPMTPMGMNGMGSEMDFSTMAR